MSMAPFDTQQTLGEIVSHNSELSRFFEELGIDYCCRKKQTIEQASCRKRLDPKLVLFRLQNYKPVSPVQSSPVDAASMTLTELADHIEHTHHSLLRRELPRLAAMAEEVSSIHGGQYPRMWQIFETFRAMAGELWAHMIKEEMCLFPMIRQIEASIQLPKLHVSSIADPIRRMEFEHDRADTAFVQLRDLSEGYKSPAWACDMFRGLFAALSELEQDMHVHVQKENAVLFPRALELETSKRHVASVS
jgi:regulator of cell morphogenesis and NO signaling